MKTPTLLFLALAISPSAFAGKASVLDVYKHSYKCRGETDTGDKVKFQLRQEQYNGTSYESEELRKVKIAGEKYRQMNVASGQGRCLGGEKAPAKFDLRDGKFKLVIDCQESRIVAKGSCESAPEFDVDDGFYDDLDRDAGDAIVGD